ncbi:MAG TPA: CopD family protein [Dehalococcoidia bacterium]|nr:CopD family protein [Dehalococcoidia bacterium]
MRLTVALLLILAAVAALTTREAAPVLAHALLVRAEPPVNATLAEAPRELTLYFSEPLERKFSTVTVVDQDGARPDQALQFDETDDTVARVRLGAAGPGFLVVSWETVSVVDGHRVSGSYPLTILNADGSLPNVTAPAATSVEGDEARPGLALAKFVLLVAGCLLVGSLLFMLAVTSAFRGEAAVEASAVSNRRCLNVAAVALLVIAVAGVAELLLQSSNIDAGLRDVLATRWGERWLLRYVALGVSLLTVVLMLRRGSRQGGVPAAIGLAAAAAALLMMSSTSHAAAGAGAFWATAIDFVHLFAVSVWIGMLGMLALLFLWPGREWPTEARQGVLEPALQRFSAIAVVSLALLLLAGLYSAGIEVARLGDLVDSGYGRALLLKLLLIVPLLAVAGYNAYVLRPAYATTSESAATRDDERPSRLERRFGLTIRLELALALSVLLVAAFLVQITPTRGTGSSAGVAAVYSESIEVGELGVALTVDPARPGFNSFEVALAGNNGFVEQVRLEFFDRSGGTSESRLDLEQDGEVYSGQGPFLDKPGDWQIRVNIRQSRDSDLSVPFDVAVVGPGGTVDDRAGSFDTPVSLTTTRVLIATLGALLATALVFASLGGGSREGGHIGAVLRRLPLFRAGRGGRGSVTRRE